MEAARNGGGATVGGVGYNWWDEAKIHGGSGITTCGCACTSHLIAQVSDIPDSHDGDLDGSCPLKCWEL